MVTVGCQEAMVLALRALRAGTDDVLLAVSPTYVGLTGAARLRRHAGAAGAGGDGRHRPRRPAARTIRRRARGGAAAARLLRDAGLREPVGRQHGPAHPAAAAGARRGGGPPAAGGQPVRAVPRRRSTALPTLKALDDRRRVVYLGSFAKTVLPGARVGYVVADQRVRGVDGTVGLLADELSKIKSMLTVNTSALAQAIVGGKLLEHGCSLVARERAGAGGLRGEPRPACSTGWRRGSPDRPPVTWNVPAGGFFVVVTRAVPGRRRAARTLGAGVRRAVDADAPLLRLARRGAGRFGCRAARSRRPRSSAGSTGSPRC